MIMETTDYVSYPIALALKRAGFDWKCDYYYSYAETSKDPHPLINTWPSVWNWNGEYVFDFIHPECSAPTLAIAMKWLREKKGLIILIGMTRIDDWFYGIYNRNGKCLKDDGTQRDCYEAALSAGIEAALELIEKKGE